MVGGVSIEKTEERMRKRVKITGVAMDYWKMKLLQPDSCPSSQ